MTAKVRVALFVAVSLVLSGTAIGQTTPRLTSKQKKERIKALPDEERKWLTDYVEPIILPEEENLFLQLTEPHQWEMFKAEFWKRRELPGLPSPYGPGYQLRYEHFRDLAATEYDGLFSDAGRTVVRLGEPAGIENLSSCGGFRQPEVWSYQSSSGSSNLVRHLFYRPSFGAPRRLWTQGDRGIFEDSRVTGFDQLCAISQNAGSCSCGLARIALEISTRGTAEVFAMGAAPKVSTEGLNALWERLASSSTPNAKAINVENSGGTAADGSVQKASAAPAKPVAAASKKERLAALPEEERKWLT
jgi:GWxTD domain-containing protein